jgi:Holliday junction resolvase
MSHPNKQKGTKAETDVVRYLQKCGWKTAERRALKGNLDCGDISGVAGVCLEVKNQKAQDLAGWVEELKVEIINAKANTGAVIHKRKGKTDVAEWYATMPVDIYLDLLKEAGY